MDNIKKTTATKTQKIASLITDGIESWVKAGEILVDVLDTDNMSLEEVAEQIDMSAGILGRFEQLGRKQLVPDLLVADYPASKHLQKLPYSEQSRLSSGSVEILTSDGVDRMNIAVRNLTPYQCRQVFSPRSVRDLAGQRAWVESSKKKKDVKAVSDEMPYHIERGQVIFDRGCSMKASQLINILAQLTPRK